VKTLHPSLISVLLSDGHLVPQSGFILLELPRLNKLCHVFWKGKSIGLEIRLVDDNGSVQAGILEGCAADEQQLLSLVRFPVPGGLPLTESVPRGRSQDPYVKRRTQDAAGDTGFFLGSNAFLFKKVSDFIQRVRVQPIAVFPIFGHDTMPSD